MVSKNKQIVIIVVVFSGIVFFLLHLSLPYIPIVSNVEKWKEVTLNLVFLCWFILGFMILVYNFKRFFKKRNEEDEEDLS
jgi:Kef-type K+ transport system membrane component KefB